MSNLRHGILARTYAVTHPPNLDIPARAFDEWDQLLFAVRGVMEVVTSAGRYIVPPHRAMWIPAGETVEIEMPGPVALRSMFLRPGLRDTPEECHALHVSALLRELILHANTIGVLWEREPEHVRVAKLVLDQLVRADDVPLRLPLPTDVRARRVAQALVTDPASLPQALARGGASRRTLERLFARQTGLTLGRWHQRARIRSALVLLADGRSVAEASAEVGYGSSSAFVAAFRRQLGDTPARYMASRRA